MARRWTKGWFEKDQARPPPADRERVLERGNGGKGMEYAGDRPVVEVCSDGVVDLFHVVDNPRPCMLLGRVPRVPAMGSDVEQDHVARCQQMPPEPVVGVDGQSIAAAERHPVAVTVAVPAQPDARPVGHGDLDRLVRPGQCAPGNLIFHLVLAAIPAEAIAQPACLRYRMSVRGLTEEVSWRGRLQVFASSI